MHDVDWAHVKDVLSRALDHPRDQREAFLLEATDNEAVRQEVRELLDIELTAGDFLETPAAALVGPMALSSDRIGPFQLLECLGEGGMGIVYRALRADGQYEQEVAVKIIRRAYLDPDHLLRFRAERQILARLAHPGIARLIDGGRTPDGLSFIAMEYVAGDRIDTYCDLHKLSLDARIRLFLQVCEAVDYAHRNLVVHRDLKPSNILVSPDATGGHVVKLLDFGIAKLLDPAPGDPTLTATGNRLMTPEYAAPEQVTGGPISTATDTYALGVLLYRLLTGCRPYQSGLDVAAVEYAVQHEEPQRPSAAASRRVEAAPVDERAANRSSTADRLRRQLRGDLDNILLKALRKEPEHRYASVDRLTSDLQRYLANEPVEARQPTLAYRAGKFIRRHRAGVSAAVFSFTVVAVAAGLLYAQTHRIAQERDRAERAFEFVVGTFDVLDPETTGQGRLAEAATQMVEAGVEQADIEFAGRPAEQARLFGVLGDLYHKLGRYPEAVAQHARALVLHRETEASAVDEHRALVRLAAAHIGAGRYLTADSLLSLAETFDVPASEAALRQLEQVEILLEKGLYEEATALASGTLFEHAALTQEDDLRLEFLRAGIAADAGRTAAAESLYSLVQERSANL
ncbi:MAG: protein kinase, partial [Bacteroidota bacterium]